MTETDSKPRLTLSERIDGFVSLFRPRDGFFVTPVLVDLNLALFIIMVAFGANVLRPDNEDLLKWGANLRPLTLHNEWWRLITCCFLHIGVFHLAMNMYALIYIGVLLEPLLGKLRFVSTYILTGIVASTASLAVHPNTISAGASGAIFGLYGMFLALLTTDVIDKSRRDTLFISIGLFVAYNLMNGTNAGIDNAAHIGGLLSGFVFGYAFYPSIQNEKKTHLQYSALAFICILVLVFSSFVYNRAPNNTGDYSDKINQFGALEASALEPLKLPSSTPKDTLLLAIKEHGIPAWNAAIDVLNSADSLQISDQIHERTQEMIRYCRLRIWMYELIYKSIDENSNQYDLQLRVYESEINSIIADLGGKHHEIKKGSDQ